MDAAYQEDVGDDTEEKYDTTVVSPHAEYFLKGISTLPEIKSKALMTTRLLPKILVGHDGSFLEGCTEKELTALDKKDAVLLFQNLDIEGTRAEVEAACAPYAYHPLSLRLLAGLILKDLHHAGDIKVAERVRGKGNFEEQQNHILATSYNSLPEPQQKLLSQIACFRSPVAYETILEVSKPIEPKGLFKAFKKKIQVYSGKLDSDLRVLIERGILHHNQNKYDLHPIVRRFAYERLTAPDRTAAHTRLQDYFETVPEPEKIEKLEDLAPVIELYHHMVRAGNLDEARKLFYDRINKPTYYHWTFDKICLKSGTAYNCSL